MSASIGDAIGSYRKGWGLLASNPPALLYDFTKVALLEMLLQIILAGGLLGTALLIGFDFSTEEFPLPLMVVGLVLLLIVIFVGAALNAVPYSLVDERTKGRQGEVIKKTIELIIPIGRYILLLFAVFIAILVATLALAALAVSSLGEIAIFIPMAFGGLLIVLALFAFQFAVPEIVLRGAGAFESMKRSWAIVSKNVFPVILFDIMFISIMIFLGGILGFLNLPSQAIAAIPSIGEAAAIAYSAIISVVNSVVITLFTTLAFYFFWKDLTRTKEAPKMPEKPKAKPVARRKARRKKR